MRSKRDTKSPLSTTTTVQVRVSFCFHLGITKTPEKSSQAEAARLLEPWLNACISTLWSSGVPGIGQDALETLDVTRVDRKSTRLNSSHQIISYAVFCLKKKKRSIYT